MHSEIFFLLCHYSYNWDPRCSSVLPFFFTYIMQTHFQGSTTMYRLFQVSSNHDTNCNCSLLFRHKLRYFSQSYFVFHLALSLHSCMCYPQQLYINLWTELPELTLHLPRICAEFPLVVVSEKLHIFLRFFYPSWDTHRSLPLQKEIYLRQGMDSVPSSTQNNRQKALMLNLCLSLLMYRSHTINQQAG